MPKPKLLMLLSEDWFFLSHFSARAIAAQRAGYDVVVVANLDKHGGQIREMGLRFQPLNYERGGINIFKELRLLKRLWSLYRYERPDIVHHVSAKSIFYGTLISRLIGVKKIVNAPVGLGYVYSSKEIKARIIKPIMQLAYRLLLNPPGSRVIFENNDDLTKFVKSRMVKPRNAILIRGAGVNIDEFLPSQKSGIPTVVLISRMLWDKGIKEFVEAAHLLHDQNIKARFILVGGPDPFNPTSISHEQLALWDRQKSVEWLGWREDIATILSEAHIACLPSYREGLPKSLIEAAAAGLPIVTTNCTGCREVVKDGVNGILVPTKKAIALSVALKELIEDPQKCKEMGAKSRKIAITEFLNERIIKETLEVYSELSPLQTEFTCEGETSSLGETKVINNPKKKIIFVATTPFAVNAFLSSHLFALSKHYEIVLCVNLMEYPLLPKISKHVKVIDVAFERKTSIFRDLKSLMQLFQIMLQEGPDAIHSITPKAGLLAMTAGFFARVPHRHHTFTGQIWANLTGFSRRFYKTIDKIIIIFSTRCFTDSRSQCHFLENENIAKLGELTVLGKGSISGVDFHRFKPDPDQRRVQREKFGTSEDVCVFVFVGRITKDKGLFDLICAFSDVAARCELSKDKNIELWIVGPDEERLEQQLREIQIEASSAVHWIGATMEPEYYMAAADLFVLPSYREGFGSVIIEAAACGIPAIAYHIDGVIDAIEDGNSGILIPVGDVRALSQVMYDLALDNEKRVELGAVARMRVFDSFSSEVITGEWTAFYEGILAGKYGQI